MLSCPRCLLVYAGDAQERCDNDGETLVCVERDPLLDHTIDRYRIIDALGTGAMGSVYLAEHTGLSRRFALKLLHGEIACEPRMAARFRREAQATAKIQHRNVVQVSDFGRAPNGAEYMVMELLEGRSLHALLGAEAPLVPARARAFTRQIAAGLEAAHRLGFVHRDLKPANVMVVDEDGAETLKILDFGLVAITDEAADLTKLTRAGYTLGTPHYMAPEQIRDPRVGPAADLYSLGTVLYEMLSGHPPFQGDMQQVMYQHLGDEPAPLPESDGLEVLARWLLQKDPSRRPSSPSELVQALDGQISAVDQEAPTLVERPALDEPVTTGERASMPTAPDNRSRPPPPERDPSGVVVVTSGRGWLALIIVLIAVAAVMLAAAIGVYLRS